MESKLKAYCDKVAEFSVAGEYVYLFFLLLLIFIFSYILHSNALDLLFAITKNETRTHFIDNILEPLWVNIFESASLTSDQCLQWSHRIKQIMKYEKTEFQNKCIYHK